MWCANVVFLHGKRGAFVVISMAESASFSASKNTPRLKNKVVENVEQT
jgi:hypothetical protein